MIREFENTNWTGLRDENGNARSTEHAILAVLMDLRAELRQLNATFGCYCVQRMVDAMVRLESNVVGRRITARDAARVMAKRRNRKRRAGVTSPPIARAIREGERQ